ncbi:hypothetical protein K439DRAFT_1629994 [Ramaria rubella]|nr:hypothetical protein K439DRAFT_1629994 [Ramaria rubella]
MAETVIRQITQEIWTFSYPFLRLGIFPVGGRSTAIKLKNGNVWVLASTPLNSETKTKLDELGDVKYIASGDALHWMFLEDFKKAYPTAKVVGPEALLTKPGCAKLDGVYGRDPPDTKYGFEDEIGVCYFSGFRNKDVAFHHPASKTLVVADLIFNLPAKEQYSKVLKKPYFLNADMGPYGWLHQKFVWFAGTDKEAMRRDVRTVAEWDFDRIIPCHGDVIENKGNEAWRAAYKAYFS